MRAARSTFSSTDKSSVMERTISRRTSLGSFFKRNSRALRKEVTSLCEISLILSRESFMLSPVSRPAARITLRCEISVFLMRRNISW